jgi:hypothetical protein
MNKSVEVLNCHVCGLDFAGSSEYDIPVCSECTFRRIPRDLAIWGVNRMGPNQNPMADLQEYWREIAEVFWQTVAGIYATEPEGSDGEDDDEPDGEDRSSRAGFVPQPAVLWRPRS